MKYIGGKSSKKLSATSHKGNDEKKDKDDDIIKEIAKQKSLNFTIPVGIRSPSDLKWYIHRENGYGREIYYPCRTCDISEAIYVNLEPMWDPDEASLIQIIGHPPIKPFPGNQDRILADLSSLRPYNRKSENRWNMELYRKLMKEYRRCERAKGNTYTETDFWAGYYFLNRILDTAQNEINKEREEAKALENASDFDEDSFLETPYEVSHDINKLNKTMLSDKKTEPLRPGDIIQYYSPIYCAGDPRGKRHASVISTDPAENYMIRLDNNELLPNETYVKRIRVFDGGKLHPHDGLNRTIDCFVMKKRALKNRNAKTVLLEQAKAVGDIVEKKVANLHKRMNNEGLPVDLVTGLKSRRKIIAEQKLRSGWQQTKANEERLSLSSISEKENDRGHSLHNYIKKPSKKTLKHRLYSSSSESESDLVTTINNQYPRNTTRASHESSDEDSFFENTQENVKQKIRTDSFNRAQLPKAVSTTNLFKSPKEVSLTHQKNTMTNAKSQHEAFHSQSVVGKKISGFDSVDKSLRVNHSQREKARSKTTPLSPEMKELNTSSSDIDDSLESDIKSTVEGKEINLSSGQSDSESSMENHGLLLRHHKVDGETVRRNQKKSDAILEDIKDRTNKSNRALSGKESTPLKAHSRSNKNKNEEKEKLGFFTRVKRTPSSTPQIPQKNVTRYSEVRKRKHESAKSLGYRKNTIKTKRAKFSDEENDLWTDVRIKDTTNSTSAPCEYHTSPISSSKDKKVVAMPHQRITGKYCRQTVERMKRKRNYIVDKDDDIEDSSEDCQRCLNIPVANGRYRRLTNNNELGKDNGNAVIQMKSTLSNSKERREGNINICQGITKKENCIDSLSILSEDEKNFPEKKVVDNDWYLSTSASRVEDSSRSSSLQRDRGLRCLAHNAKDEKKQTEDLSCYITKFKKQHLSSSSGNDDDSTEGKDGHSSGSLSRKNSFFQQKKLSIGNAETEQVTKKQNSIKNSQSDDSWLAPDKKRKGKNPKKKYGIERRKRKQKKRSNIPSSICMGERTEVSQLSNLK